MQNFKALRQSLLGELAMSPEERRRRKKEKKMPFIVATYVYASSARTPLGPKCKVRDVWATVLIV